MNTKTIESIKNATAIISKADRKLADIKSELQEVYNEVQFRINKFTALEKNSEELEFLKYVKKSLSKIAKLNDCPVS